MAAYDAFISYSHAKDKPIAAALQSAVQRLGKPWYRRRALRAFRDDASLSATPALWPSIETALAQSRYLILLASPEAAASPWVTKEVAYWLDHKSADTLLIAITDGDLGWDNAAGDFIWRDGASLPAALAGRFRSEPKWVDLRAYRAGTSTGDARFTELAADFAATIHGMPKDDLLSQEVREQRRALGLAWGAVSLLLVLATFAGWQWKLTADAERLAQLQRDRAERALAAAARTSNTLVFEVSREFRDRTGMPVELRRKILSRAQELQRELSESGDSTPVLRWSEAATLQEAVETLIALGEYKGALESARRGLAIAEALAASDPANSDNRSLLANSHNKLADALLATGQREMALTHYQAGLSVNEALAAVDPANTRWRGDVAHNLRVIGDIQKASGRREDAVALFRKSQAIVQQLATTDPVNTEWQRELAVSHDRIGDTLAASGQRKGALAEYQSLLAIVGKLVAIDPSNARWQQDLSVVRKKIGDMFLSLGSPREALAAHLQGVATSEKLVTGDPGNAEWQRQLSTGHVSVGDALAALDRREEALASYLSSLAIRKQLASAAPSSILGQHDLAALYDRMGNLLLRMERRDEALAHYRNALAISNQLVTIDPVGVEWQRNLSVSHKRVGAILFADGRLEEALVEFRRSLEIAQRLHAADPSNTQWAHDLFVSYTMSGDGLEALGRGEEALAEYRNGLAIADKFGAADAGTGRWGGLSLIRSKISRLEKESVVQIDGAYEGTNTTSNAPGEHRISLTFRLHAWGIDATFRNSLGGHGRGTGTIAGGNIGTLSLHSSVETCPGSYTATFKFLEGSVSWTYSGKDCTGAVQGRGTATKTKQ